MALEDFYPGTTKRFSVTCTVDSAAVDITNDVLNLRLKSQIDDTDAEADLFVTADVATEGASGRALFEIAPNDTADLAPGAYYTDIEWERANGDVHVVLSQYITVLNRVSDA